MFRIDWSTELALTIMLKLALKTTFPLKKAWLVKKVATMQRESIYKHTATGNKSNVILALQKKHNFSELCAYMQINKISNKITFGTHNQHAPCLIKHLSVSYDTKDDCIY